MKQKLSKVLKYIISLSVAGILVYFSFRGVDWQHFCDVILKADWVWIVISMALGILAYWIRALRWHILLSPFDTSLGLRRVFDGVNIGYISNFVFPRAGEFVRCGVVSRGKVTYDKALATVVLERSIDVLCLLFLIVLLLGLKWNEFGTFFTEHIFTGVKSKAALGIIILFLAAFSAAALWLVWSLRDRNRIAGKVFGFVAGIWNGIKSCFRIPRKGSFFTYTALIWLLYWGMSYTTVLAIKDIAPLFGPADALFLALAASLGWLVPAPGGIGSFHFIVSLALTTVYSLTWQDGIIFATLSHESQSITMIICGILSYISFVLSKEGEKEAAEG